VQILNSPSKAAKLPALPGDFERAGYATSFYYGGELEFADFKSYLLSHHFARVVGKGAFAPKDWSSKWGAHDHVVLGRVLSDLRTAPRPFFTTVFTLSSHEPYDVPMAPVFPGTDETTRFLNAHAYADRSVGAFIAAAKHEPWWDSTLVVIIADHGHPLPRVAPSADERVWLDQHIPMLWLGGALAVRDTVVSTVGAQTDLAPTLLAQLGIAHARYAWGKNLLARDVTPFAYFAYMDGFGWVTPRGRLVWDHAAGRVMQRAGAADSADLRSGQAYQRLSYQDYLDR
jgi:phosphoglycerol transferase MdoB-like AlkP superfamily enzyme